MTNNGYHLFGPTTYIVGLMSAILQKAIPLLLVMITMMAMPIALSKMTLLQILQKKLLTMFSLAPFFQMLLVIAVHHSCTQQTTPTSYPSIILHMCRRLPPTLFRQIGPSVPLGSNSLQTEGLNPPRWVPYHEKRSGNGSVCPGYASVCSGKGFVCPEHLEIYTNMQPSMLTISRVWVPRKSETPILNFKNVL